MPGLKILFLGGTGNISAECAALLHQRGHEIIVLSRGRGAVPPEYRSLQADRKDVAAMRAVLTQPALWAELRAKGLYRAQQFSWDTAAQQLLQIYQQFER